MVGADRPDPVPRNPSNAGTKSCVDNPCRYSNGNTSLIFGDLRHHAGRITEANRFRSPVVSSMRLSLTRGALTSTAPDEVNTCRVSAWPLRTTRRRPRSSSWSTCAAMYAATSASNAAASIRRAPSRTISSINDPPPVVAAGVDGSSVTNVSTGVPSRPTLAGAGLLDSDGWNSREGT
jgi:hypothetical protein